MLNTAAITAAPMLPTAPALPAAAPSHQAVPRVPSVDGSTLEAEKLIASRVGTPGLLEDVKFLSSTPRVTGSPEFMKAAEWVVAQAKAAGFDARIVKSRSQGSPWGGS